MTPQPPLDMTAAGTAPSILQAIAALLIVLGLIFGVTWALRRFAFGQLGGNLLQRGPKPEKTLRIAETLWLDGRHRIVAVIDNGVHHTLLIGPGQPIQLNVQLDAQPTLPQTAPSATLPPPLS